MKDWLTVIIVLLIIGIVLDGIRRARLARRENISLSKNAKKADRESDFSVSSSEFPSGGARVATVRDEKLAEDLNDNVRKNFESQRVTAGAPRRIPEQVSLNLDESVPMLMDSVEETEVDEIDGEAPLEDSVLENEEANAQQTYAQAPGDDIASEQTPYADDSDSEYEDDLVDDESDEYNDHREPAIGNLEDMQDDSLDDEPALSKPRPASHRNKAYAQPPKQQEPAIEQRSSETKVKDKPLEEKPDIVYEEPDEVLIMNLMAKSGQRIAGSDLLAALMQEGLKFGDMDIFHRHKDNDGDGPIIYSIANMVVPGTFNLAEMNEFETPGVSMFLSLPVAGESLAAYNDLAVTAKNLASTLGCELKDENRSVMTNQTIEHGRQRVIEYERKRKLARA
ncbi:MAG: cell division protein ZipA [Agarilytica sp.]